MIKKTKTSILHRLKSDRDLSTEDVQPAREYIKRFWVNLERYHPRDEDTLIGLPNAYFVPAHDPAASFNFDEMYYWDSYFMVQGMLREPDNKELVMGILDNLFSLLRRFRMVPNANRTYLMSRSQPPLLTSFIFDVYEAYQLDTRWLAQAMGYAKAEYETVWMGTSKPHWRQVHQGLSRYYDVNMLHDLTEAESGWDMTPRFGRKCLDFVPVDLNALLFRYEMDFSRYARLIGDKSTAAKWEVAAAERARTMDKLMWSELRDLYYDYNFVRAKRGGVASLASFYPLWAGMVDDKRAKEMVKSLKRFENKGGLATTIAEPLNQLMPGTMPVQWAHPNGWAPLHFLVVKGLQRYGCQEDARRIALKWLRTNLDWFNTNGVFLEKYNVVQPARPPAKGMYPSQTGFGWTNAIFERFCQDFIDD